MSIKVDHLHKEFVVTRHLLSENKKVTVLKDISFVVEKGDILAVLGGNGSGKSTLLKCLTGVLSRTSGDIKVNDFDPFIERRKLTNYYGVLFSGKTVFIEDIKVKDNFELIRRMYGLSKNEFRIRYSNLDQFFDINELEQKEFRKLSYGQRKRCEICSILLHNPSLIFLDEPTVGLDFKYIECLKDFLLKYNQESNSTVLLITHDMHFLEQLAINIIYLENGRIIFKDSYDNFINQVTDSKTVHIYYGELKIKAIEMEKIFEGMSINTDQAKLSYKIKDNNVNAFLKKIVDYLNVVKIEIEPVYMFSGKEERTNDF